MDGRGYYFSVVKGIPGWRTHGSNLFPPRADIVRLPGMGRTTRLNDEYDSYAVRADGTI